MVFRSFFTVLLLLTTLISAHGRELQAVPDQVYAGLEYLLDLDQSSVDFDQDKLSELISFVGSIPAESSAELKERQGASGAFYSFSVKSDLSRVLDYAYNPDLPAYLVMPSSLRDHQWLTPKLGESLRDLSRLANSNGGIGLLRGQDWEVITPNTNTGGYYGYNQDRIVTVLPGPTGPVFISVSNQNDLSEVGKKGCIVGDDQNWNYLYSEEKGLNTAGLGWVNSYMYFAHSVLVYVADSSTHMIHVGSFKWLSAGWAKMNMVNSGHILDGIKRFASAFKEVLEAPGLPNATALTARYRELLQSSEQGLRHMVQTYLQALDGSERSRNSGSLSSTFQELLSSGKYLQQMSRKEMVRVLLLEYLKSCIGKKSPIRFGSKTKLSQSQVSLF